MKNKMHDLVIISVARGNKTYHEIKFSCFHDKWGSACTEEVFREVFTRNYSSLLYSDILGRILSSECIRVNF